MNYLKKMMPKKEKKETEGKKNTMIVLRKKQIVAVSLLILVGIAGYLNWTFKNDAVDPDVAVMYNEASKKLGEAQMVSGNEPDGAEATQAPQQAQANGYFAQAKLDREVKRSESIEMLTELINAQGTDKEAKTNAENQVHALADYTEKEVTMENMIKAKGFKESVVFMSENLISIAIQSEGMNEVDAAVIQDIVTSVTGYGADKIKIVEIKTQDA